MTLSPHLVALFALTTGIGWLMIVMGLGKRALDWTRRPDVCPGCGRQVEHARCGCGR